MVLPRKFPVFRQIKKKIQKSLEPSPDAKYVVNRNPRNLEFIRIARMNQGYEYDKPGRVFWNKLELNPSGKYISAQMVHFTGGPIVEASTQEWAVKKHLYKTNDTSAYINLARVFAQRCLESGFFEMKFGETPVEGSKTELFVKTLQDNGIVLSEPWFIKPEPVVNRFVGRKEKPYASLEDDDSKIHYFHHEHRKK